MSDQEPIQRPPLRGGNASDAHRVHAQGQPRARTADPPSLSLSQSVKKIGIRKLIRQGFGRRIIAKISRRDLVKASTYREYERRIDEYSRRRRRPKRSL